MQYYRSITTESKLLHIAQGYLDDDNDDEFDDGEETSEEESPLEVSSTSSICVLVPLNC